MSLAAIAGGLYGLRPHLLRLMTSSMMGPERPPSEIGLLVSLLTIFTVVITLGIFVAGYGWARQADLPRTFGRFAVLLFGATAVGFGLVTLPLVVFLPASDPGTNALLSVVDGVGRTLKRLLRPVFVGLAGGVVAHYRSGTNTTPRQRVGTDPTSRFALAVGLAGLAGLLNGLQSSIPLLFHSTSLGSQLSALLLIERIELITSLVSLLSFAVTIGIFFAGYRWTVQADVPAAYGRFTGSMFAAAFVGHAGGFLPTILFLARDQSLWLAALVTVVTIATASTLVTLPGLAGGAIAEYRSSSDLT